MKTYRIDVTQDFQGVIDGTIDIKARSSTFAIKKFMKMSNKKKEKMTHWNECDKCYQGLVLLKLLPHGKD